MLYGAAAESHLRRLDVLQNACLRLVLGARNTTPIISMQVESHVPPLSLRRGYLLVRQLLTLRYRPHLDCTVQLLQLNSSLLGRAYPFHLFASRAVFWMQSLDIYIRRVPEALPRLFPPALLHPYISIDCCPMVVDDVTFNAYRASTFSGYHYYYSDGSRIVEHQGFSTGAAVYDPQKGSATCWRLPPDLSVLGAELYGILGALKQIATTLAPAVVFTGFICGTAKCCPAVVSEIWHLLVTLNASRPVCLHWIRAHIGIRGNEIADLAASRAHANDRVELHPLSCRESVAVLWKAFYSYWEDYWHGTSELTQTGQFLLTIRSHISQEQPLINLYSRRAEIVLYHLRMGHAGVMTYLYRFNMSDGAQCPHSGCADEESIEHMFLQCPAHAVQRQALQSALSRLSISTLSVRLLLGADPAYVLHRLDILQLTVSFLQDIGRLATL